MNTIEVEIEGKKHTVPLPAGFLSQSDVDKEYLKRDVVSQQYVLSDELNRRFKDWVPKDKAAEDQQVISTVLKNNPQKTDDDLESAKKTWHESDLKPVLSENETLRKKLLRKEITEAGREFFSDHYVTPPADGKPSYLETLVDGMLEWDKDLGSHIALDAAGKRIPAQNPTGSQPYAGPRNLIKTLAENEAYKAFLKPVDRNNSSEYKGGNGAPSGVPGSYKPRGQMTDTEKLAAIKELGHQGYMKLPAK